MIILYKLQLKHTMVYTVQKPNYGRGSSFLDFQVSDRHIDDIKYLNFETIMLF